MVSSFVALGIEKSTIVFSNGRVGEETISLSDITSKKKKNHCIHFSGTVFTILREEVLKLYLESLRMILGAPRTDPKLIKLE